MEIDTMVKKLNRFFLENDWFVTYLSDGSLKAEKKIVFPHLAGTISDGTRLITIHMDERGRYLAIDCGWKDKDVDLRNFKTAKDAVDALIELYKKS